APAELGNVTEESINCLDLDTDRAPSDLGRRSEPNLVQSFVSYIPKYLGRFDADAFEQLVDREEKYSLPMKHVLFEDCEDFFVDLETLETPLHFPDHGPESLQLLDTFPKNLRFPLGL